MEREKHAGGVYFGVWNRETALIGDKSAHSRYPNNNPRCGPSIKQQYDTLNLFSKTFQKHHKLKVVVR